MLCVLTVLLGAEFHSVTGVTLKAIVRHHHEHAIIGVGHQVFKNARWFRHSGVETSGLLLLPHPQLFDLTGVTGVV